MSFIKLTLYSLIMLSHTLLSSMSNFLQMSVINVTISSSVLCFSTKSFSPSTANLHTSQPIKLRSANVPHSVLYREVLNLGFRGVALGMRGWSLEWDREEYIKGEDEASRTMASSESIRASGPSILQKHVTIVCLPVFTYDAPRGTKVQRERERYMRCDGM